MTTSIEQYNQTVQQQQARHGRLETRDPPGSRLRPGEWAGQS
jgi:hypothetical protein